jgi:hypothetical protein
MIDFAEVPGLHLGQETGCLDGFYLQFLQVIFGNNLKLRQNRFLAHTFQFIIHKPPDI